MSTRGVTMKKHSRRWTKREDEKLKAAVTALGANNWRAVEHWLAGHDRTADQCQRRWQSVLREGLVKGAFTEEEDDIIVQSMLEGGLTWMQIAGRIPGRIGKQCRERWTNHLDPNLKKGGWTQEEDMIMVEAQKRWGNAWTKIAELLPGRAENAVKNRWNSAFRRNNSSIFGKPTSERTLAAIARARKAMEDIDKQTQVNYRGNHSIAEVLPPSKHRPYLRPGSSSSTAMLQNGYSGGGSTISRETDSDDEEEANYRAAVAGGYDVKRPCDVDERATTTKYRRRGEDDRSPNRRTKPAEPDGLGLLGLAIASECSNNNLSNHNEATSITSSEEDLDQHHHHIRARRHYDDDDDDDDEGTYGGDLQRVAATVLSSATKNKRQRDENEGDDKAACLIRAAAAAVGEASDPDDDASEEDQAWAPEWTPPVGKITAVEAMRRYPQIRNHNQLRHLPRIKVRRPSQGRAAGCDMWVYEEAQVRTLASDLAYHGKSLDDDDDDDDALPKTFHHHHVDDDAAAAAYREARV